MRFAGLTFVFAALLVSPSPARAQDPAPKDHPRFSGMPAYHIENADVQEFGVGEFNTGTDEARKVEGKYWKIDYALVEGKPKAGPLQSTTTPRFASRSRGTRIALARPRRI